MFMTVRSQFITTGCPFLHSCSQISSHGVLKQCRQRKRSWMKLSVGICWASYMHSHVQQTDEEISGAQLMVYFLHQSLGAQQQNHTAINDYVFGANEIIKSKY